MSAVILKKGKEPFEKIRSNIDKRRVLGLLMKEKTEIVCKGDGEALFGFAVEDYNEREGLLGRLINISGEPPQKGEAIIANFAVAEEKYFMQSEYDTRAGVHILRPPEAIYLLQRRAHSRVNLPEGTERGVNIIKHNGKVSFIRAELLDVSAGGCRILCAGIGPRFAAGDTLTAVMHIKDKWRFEVEGQIRHCIPGDANLIFGVQFINLNNTISQKIMMMMLELQRWAVQKKSTD